LCRMEARPCCWPTPVDPELEHLQNKRNRSSRDGRAVKQKITSGKIRQKKQRPLECKAVVDLMMSPLSQLEHCPFATAAASSSR
jgi:hypothetical protein